MGSQRVAKSGKNAPWRPEKVRERIQATLIVERLQQYFMGKIKLSSAQVRTAEILLRKTVPDLTSVQYAGELTVKHDITSEPMSADEWQDRYCRET